MGTGWTPDVLAEMPDRFRSACHWVAYTRALVGTEGIPSGEVPMSATPEAKRAALRLRAAVTELRASIYPEGDD
jgi:hypothetical protein